MKLVDEIIASLSNRDSSLPDVLLKTKVLLYKLGRKEFIEWVNHELNGYPDGTQLPEYRVLPAQVRANLTSITWQAPSHPLPLQHLTLQQRSALENAHMRESLAVLENMVAKGGKLTSDIPLEFNAILGKTLEAGVYIQRAWSEVTAATVSNIFIQVRSRLLDFMLELDAQLPGDLDEQEISRRIERMDTAGMFQNTVFGANATIVVGERNTTSVQNVVLKGNFSALAGELRKHKVPEEDIRSLQDAIANDANEVDNEQKRFGPRVAEWLQRTLTKAADASWQLELGIAASMLHTGLQKYYGWL